MIGAVSVVLDEDLMYFWPMMLTSVLAIVFGLGLKMPYYLLEYEEGDARLIRFCTTGFSYNPHIAVFNASRYATVSGPYFGEELRLLKMDLEGM